MRQLLAGLARILFWRYARGSWQYDLLCLVIVGFIFLTPRSVFDGTIFSQNQTPGDQPCPPMRTVEVDPQPETAGGVGSDAAPSEGPRERLLPKP